MSELQALAEAYGIEPAWRDTQGETHEVAAATLEALLLAMGADPRDPQGELRRVQANAPLVTAVVEPDLPVAHGMLSAGEAFTLELEDGGVLEGRAEPWDGGITLGRPLPLGSHRLHANGRMRHLLAAPGSCLSPGDLGVGRAFGLATQLYALRSRRSSAIGDLADLVLAVEAAAAHGADLFGFNPLHALFMADPSLISPYAPSSRRFVNPLYVAVDMAALHLGLPVEEDAVPADELLDHPAVAAAKRAAFERLWAGFGPEHPKRSDFLAYRQAGGEALRRFCLFEALHEATLAADNTRWAFRTWPAGWSDPTSPEVAAFAAGHAHRVEFFAFLQWLAEEQLATAQHRARASGMRLGLYRDLAVGVHPDGAQVWADPAATVRGVSIGAPPDPFSPKGQVWNLAPFSPSALERDGYAALLADLDATARHAGAMRIDHVMGLSRQFWVPEGMDATAGAYVRFPFDTTARLAALVSHRHRCVVVGEDLGTLPYGFHDSMRRYGLLSCQVLWFERQDGRVRPPWAWTPQALASISTHDLPTVDGFWAGRDIDWRDRLGLFPDAARAESDRQGRAWDRQLLRDALNAEGIPTEPIVVALHRLLARTSSELAIVQLEDLAGWLEQVNLPGTIDEHPNWRRRFAEAIEDLLASPRALEILAALREERPR